MADEHPRYQAYLLRLWQVISGGHLVWRASLEDVHTGTRRGFASLDELISFLRHLRGRSRQPGEHPDAPDE